MSNRLGRLAALIVVVAAGFAALPRPAEALVGMSVECTFVDMRIYRTSTGDWTLETVTSPGPACVISDRDGAGLPWEAATTGRAYLSASNLGVSCSSGVMTVSGSAFYFVETAGGATIDTYPSTSNSMVTVTFRIDTRTRAAAMTMGANGLTAHGAGFTGVPFNSGAWSCNVPPPSTGKTLVAAWNEGVYSFEDTLT